MRILVVGAGAVGGYFGGLLADRGRDVTFLVRSRRAEQLRSGLVIRGAGRELRVPVKILTAGEASAPFDVVLLAVKAYQLEQVIADFRLYTGPDTMILPTLNGMRHMDTLTGVFGSGLLGGVARVVTTVDSEGHIQDSGSFHDLIYGERNGQASERVQRLDATLRGCGFDARLSMNIERDLWEKWLFLASVGAVTCLMGGSLGEVARAERGLQFTTGVLAEAIAIIEAVAGPLRAEYTDTVRAQLTDRGSKMTSSMYRDMQAGAAVEADQIIGDLIRRGAQKGIAAPLLSSALARLNVYSGQRQPAPG